VAQDRLLKLGDLIFDGYELGGDVSLLGYYA